MRRSIKAESASVRVFVRFKYVASVALRSCKRLGWEVHNAIQVEIGYDGAIGSLRFKK